MSESGSHRTDLVALQRERQKRPSRRRRIVEGFAFVAAGLALGFLIGRAVVWSPAPNSNQGAPAHAVPTACPPLVRSEDLERDWASTAHVRAFLADSYASDAEARAIARLDVLDRIEVVVGQLKNAGAYQYDGDLSEAKRTLNNAFVQLERGNIAQFLELEDRGERMLFPAILAWDRLMCAR